eukprot:8884260-Alexandrium_andersonii.AAC.1
MQRVRLAGLRDGPAPSGPAGDVGPTIGSEREWVGSAFLYSLGVTPGRAVRVERHARAQRP